MGWAHRALRGQLGPRGPEAVSSSLRRGLAGAGKEFRLNPRRLDGNRVVGVLSNLSALEEALEWRRAAPDRRLLAGPNLVILPSDARELMTAPELDVCIVPSEWVKRLYEEDAPELVGRIAVWPAGVDPLQWAPQRQPEHRRGSALLYRKWLPGQANASDEEVEEAARALRAAGFSVKRLDYGRFSPAEYRSALDSAELMVFFSPTESQCLAQVEAWAANVCTLVWAQGVFHCGGRVYVSSSAPYLSDTTGLEFRHVEELTAILENWDQLRARFRPREWVLANMTDERCATAYWKLAHPGASG